MLCFQLFSYKNGPQKAITKNKNKKQKTNKQTKKRYQLTYYKFVGKSRHKTRVRLNESTKLFL